ncbi:EF-hand domain-containing protein [Sphingomonas sp. PAMC 26605]|uniref:EF-hand domain-containing protein n=1 Tax=Sphingomonas sp. PAMC 26605 TaxID=1112214 RepID=UPI0004958749|nr:EF-hand domain-containing protein [Sphingomonas sp. PAMC 26605]
MWRYLVGGLAALALAAAGMLILNRNARSVAALPLSSPAPPAAGATAPLPATVPEASDKTREQKRFDRYDKDRDGKVTREEYLAARRKAFAKLDVNHDGMLSFDEWAVKAEGKFALADADKSGAMTPVEFARTAVKRKPPRIRRDCPPAAKDEAPANGEES